MKSTLSASNLKSLLPWTLIIVGIFSRLIPHAPNWTAVASMALLAGAVMRPLWKAYLIPVSIMFLSDLVIGFHSGAVTIYLIFLMIVGVGQILLAQKRNVARVFAASSIASLLFFFLTNLAVWYQSGMYPRNGEGLALCFEMALPFWSNQFFGDLTYSLVAFALWKVMEKYRWVPVAQMQLNQ